MLTNQAFIVWLKKILYALLLVCVGGVGPLIYIDALSPHLGVRTYHIAIFESGRARQPSALPATLRGLLLYQRWLAQISGQTDWLSTPPKAAAGLARFFESDLSQGYLLNTARFTISAGSLPVSRISLAALIGRSACLAPPEKPPSFFPI